MRNGRKNRARIAFFILALPLLSACTIASVHNSKGLEGINSYEQVSALIPIGSTKEEVRQKLGNPISQSSGNGQSFWSYIASESDIGAITVFLPTPAARRTKSLTVIFDSAGKVMDHQFTSSNVTS